MCATRVPILLIVLDDAPLDELAGVFATAHQKVFGFTMPDRGLAIEGVSVEVISQGTSISLDRSQIPGSNAPVSEARVFFSGDWRNVPVWNRDEIIAGAPMEGPCSHRGTSRHDRSRNRLAADMTGEQNLLLTRAIPRLTRIEVGTEVDPVLLELFHNLFFSTAERMGAVIRNTSYSVNIKERLDYSCALFDSEGQLVANAPHMPVDLGSMGTAVHRLSSGERMTFARAIASH